MNERSPTPGKSSFDAIYDMPDPRAYVKHLGDLGYQIPDHARPVFRALLTAWQRLRGDDPVVADLCCSYGFNAAVLNHDVTYAQLRQRYADPGLADLSPPGLAASDRTFFAARRRPDAVPVIGIDVAADALRYARDTGVIDIGSVEDLETTDPSPQLVQHLRSVGLLTVTGGIGYIGEATFARLLDAIATDPPPWVAAFVLRWVDMRPIVEVLQRRGLTVERMPDRTFRQRRFTDDDERAYAFDQLRRLGLDPDGVETDGYHHTVLHVARPPAEACEPLSELLSSIEPHRHAWPLDA